MKKLLLMGALFVSIFAGQNVYSACGGSSCGGGYGYSGAGYNAENCGEQATGQCYCKYVRYEPCYSYTTRCYQEQIPYTVKCCRYVPQYYQVQRCRYVPQYYCTTECRQVPEYYDVQKYRTCTKSYCEPKCNYVPRYYWKYTNCPSACAPSCP